MSTAEGRGIFIMKNHSGSTLVFDLGEGFKISISTTIDEICSVCKCDLPGIDITCEGKERTITLCRNCFSDPILDLR